MSEKKITFNPQAIQKPPEVKKESSKKKQKKKKKEPESTRSIRFVRRKVSNYITYFFYTSFILMILVSFSLLSKMNYLTSVAQQKAINPTKIAEEVQTINTDKEEVNYHAKEFIKILFTADKDTYKSRQERLTRMIAPGLDQARFNRATESTKRTLQSAELVNSHVIEKNNQALYSVTFSVSFIENGESYETELTIPCSYKNKQFLVANYPTYLNTEPSVNEKKNTYVYNEGIYYTDGDPVTDVEQKKIDLFLTDFFKLYVKNDENLKLISNVTGLKKATLVNVKPQNFVEKKNKIIVEGLYTFYYQKGNEISSFFSVQLIKTKDSYFVENITS